MSREHGESEVADPLKTQQTIEPPADFAARARIRDDSLCHRAASDPEGYWADEAAVVGRAHEVKGRAVAAFVTLRRAYEPGEALHEQIRKYVAHAIGPIAHPHELIFVPELPKTRSGKIMRRLLRDIAEGKEVGDTTTLADPDIVGTSRLWWQTDVEAKK